MSLLNEKPVVLYQFESSEDKQMFCRQFGNDFTIIVSHSDESSKQELMTNPAVCCVFLDYSDLNELVNSTVFRDISEQSLNLPVILLGQAVNIETISNLLQNRFVSKCYNKPYDVNLIRSDVFTANIELNPMAREIQTLKSPLARLSVLIVDDEILATKYLVKQLEQISDERQLIVAENAAQALNYLCDPENRIAVVISDQRMPGVKGDQLLNEIRQTYPQVIRILTSAYQEVDIALGAINQGKIYRYLRKPWDAVEINLLIDEALTQYREQCIALEINDSNIVFAHKAMIAQRTEMIYASFGNQIDKLSPNTPFTNFITFLQTIDISSPNRTTLQSSLRANNETDLENKLITDLKSKLELSISGLRRLNEFNHKQKNSIILAIIQQIQFENLAEESLSEFGDNKEIALRIINLAVSSIDTLLTSSDLQRIDLKISQQKNNLCMENQENAFFKIYKHILSPLSNLSKTLVEHQSALIILFILKDLLNQSIELAPCNGEFKVSIHSILHPASTLKASTKTDDHSRAGRTR